MKLFLLIIEFISAGMLILLILMHSPKGDGLAGIGGQAHMYNTPKGLESGLNKATAIFAGIFIVVATILSLFF